MNPATVHRFPDTHPDPVDRTSDVGESFFLDDLGRERSQMATAAVFGVLRRAIVEGRPVTREGLAEEAAFTLGMSAPAALHEVDVVAQRLGVASLV
jgi:hypothetical protein